MELELQKHLRSGKTLDSLFVKYRIQYKIDKRFNNLVLFKYHLKSPFREKIVQESRGIILDRDNNWNVISRSFDKFFNYTDSLASELDYETIRFLEKLDGSLLTIYFYKDCWRVQTSFTTDASGNLYNSELKFNCFFWDIFYKNNMNFPLATWEDFCFSFELTSPKNNVVVDYEESNLTLIGVRDRITQEEQDVRHFDNFYTIVKHYSIYDITNAINSLKNTSGFDREGFVAVDDNFNRIKIKSDDYFRLHYLKYYFTDRSILRVVINDEIDETLTRIPELKLKLSMMAIKFKKLENEILSNFDKVKHIVDRKEFAIEAKKFTFSYILFFLKEGRANNVKNAFKIVAFKKQKYKFEDVEKYLGINF